MKVSNKKIIAGVTAIIILVVVSALFIVFNLQKNTDNNSENKLPISMQNETQNPNIQTLANGLIIEDIELGGGDVIKSGDTISIHYTGTLENGTKFDSSVDRRQKFETTIGVGQVIMGWDEGIPGMREGGKRKLTIPSDLAYGDRDIPGIPGGSTLIFVVEQPEIVE